MPVSITCRFRSRTASATAPTTSPATTAHSRASARSPPKSCALKIPLTINVVVHRANIDRIAEMVALALALGASRVEIAHVQYYGWALKNRAALMPSAEQVARAAETVEELRRRHHGEIVIDAVVPDYYARLPKPCVGGWGRRSLNVTPAGKVLPCHAAESIPGPRILVGARAFARRHLEEFAGLQCLSRHRLDAGAVPKLRAARHRFRRLPLPGFRAHRRRPRHRPGLPSRARSRWGRGARRSAARRALRLPAHVTSADHTQRSSLHGYAEDRHGILFRHSRRARRHARRPRSAARCDRPKRRIRRCA